jgi:hypothetical protein
MANDACKLTRLMERISELPGVTPKMMAKLEGAILAAFKKASDLLPIIAKFGCFVAGTTVLLASVPQFQQSAYGHGETRWNFETPAENTHLESIDQVPLGSRVATQNPVREDYDLSLPEPDETWVHLQMVFRHKSGAIVDIDVLRPAEWVERNQLGVGSVIAFGNSEIETTGGGRVTGIGPCPRIADGPGSVVTARYVTRQTADLVTATFADGTQLTGTRQHPVWCATRQDWVGLGELLPGEEVETRNGPLAVRSVQDVPGLQPVYNLEVHGEHVYEVTDVGVLVHNNAEADCLRFAELTKRVNGGEVLDAGDLIDYQRLKNIYGYHGPKSRYTNPGTHDPTQPSLWDQSKTPLPADAADVYGNAIPDVANTDPVRQSWYGIGADGKFYRYQGTNGEVHFNAILNWNELPASIRKRFKEMGIDQ